MDREEIIRMAREACSQAPREDWNSTAWVFGSDGLETFAALVAAAERKRLHDKFMEIHKSQQHSNNYWHFAARKIAEET